MVCGDSGDAKCAGTRTASASGIMTLSEFFFEPLVAGSSLVAQSVKNLLAMQETWVQFLDLEDPLEKEMATHSSILTWRIPMTEEPGRLHFMESQRVRND